MPGSNSMNFHYHTTFYAILSVKVIRDMKGTWILFSYLFRYIPNNVILSSGFWQQSYQFLANNRYIWFEFLKLFCSFPIFFKWSQCVSEWYISLEDFALLVSKSLLYSMLIYGYRYHRKHRICPISVRGTVLAGLPEKGKFSTYVSGRSGGNSSGRRNKKLRKYQSAKSFCSLYPNGSSLL
jgi:hypothetical protein